WMLQKVEKGENAEDLKMNVLQAIYYIIQSWDEVNSNTIRNYAVLDNIADAIEALDFLDPMQLVETFRTDDSIVTDLEDTNNSFEIPVVSANVASTSLETICTFLLQEDGTEEYLNILRKIENFIRRT
ncbi:10162_t:CDS:2, partial [Gigaspora rosea]